MLHAAVPQEHLGYLLNACLVGLAKPGSGGDLDCLGMGIVRAVDMPARLLYVLTPLDPDTLEQVTTLQVGRPLHPVVQYSVFWDHNVVLSAVRCCSCKVAIASLETWTEP